MASSGSFLTDSCKNLHLQFYWSIKSQSIENNTTTISWSLSGYRTDGATGYITCGGFKVVIDGKTVLSKSTDYRIDVYNGDIVASGDYVISHSADGSKSFTAYAEAGIYYSAINCTGEKTWQLTTIPRSASITSASDIILGNTCNIKWTPASSNFKYKIKFSLGDWYYTTGFIVPNTTNSYPYTGYIIDGTTIANNTTIYAQLPNNTSGIMTAVLYTYNSDGTQIGSEDSKTFKVTIPDDVAPVVGEITLNPIDITTVDGTKRNILVKGKNKILVSVSGCSAGTGSSIKSYTFSGPNLSIVTTNTSVTSSSVVFYTGTLTYTVTVTDTRGRTNFNTATIICYEYSDPYFESFNAYKANADGVADGNGSYIKCNYTLNYNSVNSTNNVTVEIFYKKNTDSNYSSINSISNSASMSGSSLLSSIDSTLSYTVYATITDNYGGSTTSTTINILGESRILNITKDGLGFAVGKMSERTDEHTNGLFECAFDAQFYKDVKFVDPTSTLKNLGLTATATELNYMDGVTSNVQTQLNSHSHGLLHTDLTKEISNTTTDSGWSMINDTYAGYLLKSIRTTKQTPDWLINNYAAGMAFGGGTTKGVVTHAWDQPHIKFAGGNGDKPVWWMSVKGAPSSTYDLNTMQTKLDNIKVTQILANGSSASSCSWTSGAFDFIIGMATCDSSVTARSTFIIPQAFLGSANNIQVADETYYTTFKTTTTSITRNSGTGILDCVYGINIV